MAAKTLPDQAYLHQIFNYDTDTGALTWRARPMDHFVRDHVGRTWNSRYAGMIVGCPCRCRNTDYLCTTVDGVRHKVHRLIWKWLTDEEPPEIDHRNGNGLDNSKDNLRSATTQLNTRNRSLKHSKLPKGVKKNRYRWAARITVDGISHFLGNFSTPAEAHAAYCKAATELHGEFANFGEGRQSEPPP